MKNGTFDNTLMFLASPELRYEMSQIHMRHPVDANQSFFRFKKILTEHLLTSCWGDCRLSALLHRKPLKPLQLHDSSFLLQPEISLVLLYPKFVALFFDH